jgi:hypothetical protein
LEISNDDNDKHPYNQYFSIETTVLGIKNDDKRLNLKIQDSPI